MSKKDLEMSKIKKASKYINNNYLLFFELQ